MDRTPATETPIGNANPDGDEVIVCRPDDPRLARRNWPQTGGFEQTVDEPIFLVIGAETSDERCARLAVRFGVSEASLIAYRKGRIDAH